MTERGIVIKNKGNFVQVRIERHSACAQCGKCGMTEKQKHADFYVENSVSANVGDIVELNIPDANTVKLAFIAYILPLIPALALFLTAILLDWKIWQALLMFIGGGVLGFIAVALIDKFRKHKWAQSPTILSKVNIKKEKETNKNE